MAPPGTIAIAAPEDVAPVRPLKAARIATDIVEKGAKEAALEPWRANIRGGEIDASLVLPRPASWWTGPKPQDCPSFCRETGTLTSLPLPVRSPRPLGCVHTKIRCDKARRTPHWALHSVRPLQNIATCTREECLAYFSNTWCLTEVLFSSLQGGAQRSPGRS